MSQRIVMVYGVYDIIHYGHLCFFKAAKKYGDKLVVEIARDVNVEKIKGRRPIHTELERKQMLSAISIIDEVRLGGVNNPYSGLKIVKPDVIALGYDQKVYVDGLPQAIKDAGLNTRIVRLKAVEPGRLNTSKIRLKYKS